MEKSRFFLVECLFYNFAFLIRLNSSQRNSSELETQFLLPMKEKHLHVQLIKSPISFNIFFRRMSFLDFTQN